MKKSLIILLAAALSILSANAQNKKLTVFGSAVDSLSRQGEAGLVVQFFHDGQADAKVVAYAITDSLGHFESALPTAGKYKLSVSGIGKIEVKRIVDIKADNTNLGTFLVKDDVQTLEGAKVVAMQKLVEFSVDKLTYKVEEDTDSKTSTVLQMLRKVPMVIVDAQDNITVNGSSSFQVYVDGKPNQMISSNPSQILKMMPASMVKKIEVVTNPGAKYDAEGVGGVINLITQSAAGSQAVPDGANGSVTLQGSSRLDGAVGTYVNAKKGKFTVGANLTTGYNRNPLISMESKATEESTGNTMESLYEAKTGTTYAFGNLNASYEIDSQNLLSASLGLMGFDQKSNSTTDVSHPLYSYGTDNLSYMTNIGTKGSVDFQHLSSEEGKAATTLSYRFNLDPTKNWVENIYDAAAMPGRRSDSKDKSIENTLQLDQTFTLAEGHSLSTGLKYINRHNSADDKLYLQNGTDFEYNAAGSMLYDYYNNIGAAYAEYEGKLGPLGIKGGLRYEHTWQQVKYGAGYGSDFSTNYGNLVPSAGLQCALGQTQSLSLAYNMRILRPGISYLNPYRNESQVTSVSYGNPDIESALSHNLNLSYSFYSPKWIVNATARYSHCGNGISEYSFYDAASVLNTTYGNIVNTNTYGLTAFVNWTATNTTRIFANGGISYDALKSDVLGSSNSGMGYNIMVGAEQVLPSDYKLGLFSINNGKSYTLEGWRSGFNAIALSVSKSFLEEKLNVQLQAFSPIDAKGNLQMEMYSKGSTYTNLNTITIPIRQINLSLTYKFGKANYGVKKTRRTINNDDVVNAEKDNTGGASSMGSGM